MTEQLPLHGIAVYNPGILSRDELKRYFVARQGLLERLLDELRGEHPDQAPQHRLIVGTRGMGKTTLLHRLALATAEDQELAQHWLALNFPEEQYNIARLSDLWVNCLDALGDTLELLGKTELLTELDNCVDALPSEEDARAEQALTALMGFADRLQRRLLLLIDNLDIVLERLTDQHWAIREVLGHQPRLLLIGASARVLESTFHYEAAFYDFFKIHELKGLSEDEMSTVLCRLAEVDDNQAIIKMIEREPGRLRTLHTLTGGNPRTAVLLYGVLAQGIEGDVRSDLERLLDQCTPLYKARFEELPAQAQKVVDAMAIHWDPLAAARLAELTRLPVNSVSTQLNRLEQQGVVEKVPLRPGKKTGFQIAERFFNIWYLMRTSRRVRRRLVWLVQFLKVFYSQDQLRERAKRHLHQRELGRGDAGLHHAEYAFSLADALEDKTLCAALQSTAIQTLASDHKLREELGAFIEFDGDEGDLKDRAERIRFMQELPELVLKAREEWPEGVEPKAFADELASAPELTPAEKREIVELLPNLSNAEVLKIRGAFAEDLDEWSQQLLGHESLIATLQKAVGEGLMRTASDESGCRVAAEVLQSDMLAAYASVLSLEDQDAAKSSEELRQIRHGIAAFEIGFAWNDLGCALGDKDDLNGAIDAFRQQLQAKPDHELAWNNLGFTLRKSGDMSGAIDAFRQQLQIKPDDEWASNNLGSALDENGDLNGAIDAFRKQLQTKPERESAWYNLGTALCKNGDLSGAIDAFRQELQVNPDHEWAWNNLGISLCKNGDLNEAIDAFRQQLQVKPDHEWAWNNLGIALSDNGDLSGAIDAYRQQLQVKPDHQSAWNNLGNALSDNGDLSGAIDAYRQQVQFKPDHQSAWYNLGISLGENGDLNGAIEAYRQQLQVKPDHEAAWNNLGGALHKNGDLSGAIDACRQGMQYDSDGSCHNDLAWLYYEQKQNLAEAEELAREAVRLDPQDPAVRHTFATLLIANNHWPEAQTEAAQFLKLSDDDYLESIWQDVVTFFREAVNQGHAADAARLLEDTQTSERLRPLYAALKAIAEGPDQLTRFAPEVRLPAEALVAQLMGR